MVTTYRRRSANQPELPALFRVHGVKVKIAKLDVAAAVRFGIRRGVRRSHGCVSVGIGIGIGQG
jgi:hypothetical protein